MTSGHFQYSECGCPKLVKYYPIVTPKNFKDIVIYEDVCSGYKYPYQAEVDNLELLLANLDFNKQPTI